MSVWWVEFLVAAFGLLLQTGEEEYLLYQHPLSTFVGQVSYMMGNSGADFCKCR